MGSLCAVRLDEGNALASPIFCGLARGGLRAFGAEASLSREWADGLLLKGEKPKLGEAMVAVEMMLSQQLMTPTSL